VGLVGGDQLGGLLETGEAVETGPHEGPDPFDPRRLDLRGHVDQHQRPGDVLARAQGEHRREATQGGPHDHRPAVGEPLGDDHLEVGGHPVDVVVPLGVPIAVAVAAGVHRGDPVALPRQPPGRAAPRMTRLRAAVQHEDLVDGRPGTVGTGRLPHLPHQGDAAVPLHRELAGLHCGLRAGHSGASLACVPTRSVERVLVSFYHGRSTAIREARSSATARTE